MPNARRFLVVQPARGQELIMVVLAAEGLRPAIPRPRDETAFAAWLTRAVPGDTWVASPYCVVICVTAAGAAAITA